jgi:hypothetical protein
MCCLQVKEMSTYLEENHLFYIPSVLPNLTTIPLTEFMAPVSDGFVADGNISCCQRCFDVTEAEYNSMIKSLSVTDYLGRIAISSMNISIFHALIIVRI